MVSAGEVLPRRQELFKCGVSVLIGCSGTFCGSALFNVATAFQQILYPDQRSLILTLRAIFFTFVSGFCLLFTHYTVAKRKMLQLGLAGNAILALFIPGICFIENSNVGTILLCTTAAFLGIFVALPLSAALGLSSNKKDIDLKCLAAGFGLSGSLSFGLWMALAHGIFGLNTRGQARYCIVTLYGFASCFAVFALFQYSVLVKRQSRTPLKSNSTSEKSACLPAAVTSSPDDLVTVKSCRSVTEGSTVIGSHETTQSSTGIAPTEDKEDDSDYAILLRKCWKVEFFRFFIFYQSFLAFPHIGPESWKPPMLAGSVIVGSFQIFDIIGRYLPIWFPRLILEETSLTYGCLLRMIIIVMVYLTAIFYKVFFFNSLPFQLLQMISLAVTNGWLSSASTIILPRRVSSPQAKSRASAFGVALAFTGVSTGMWTSYGLMRLLPAFYA